MIQSLPIQIESVIVPHCLSLKTDRRFLEADQMVLVVVDLKQYLNKIYKNEKTWF